jgi:hypothetical protein
MSEEGVEIEVDEKSSMLYVILGYGLVLVGIIAAAAYYLFFKGKEKKRGSAGDVDEALATNTVGLQDITYIISKLKPDSDPLDVLLAVASTPESIAWSTKTLGHRAKVVEKRLAADKAEEAKKKAEAKKSNDDKMFDLGDDWADDDDEDEETKEKTKLANKVMEEKQKLDQDVAKASGKIKIPLEGVDEGVIGQNWVEKSLQRVGAWPPKDLRFLNDMTFEHEGKQVSAMDHPGLRRNLCYIAGRLNSIALNSHPELCKRYIVCSLKSIVFWCADLISFFLRGVLSKNILQNQWRLLRDKRSIQPILRALLIFAKDVRCSWRRRCELLFLFVRFP